MSEEQSTFQALRVPAFCPQCGGLTKGKSTSTYYDYGVCVNCFIFFIEGREQRWKDGWRPTPSDMDAFRDWLF